MDVRVALTAAQRLSIDVGNMGLRLALLEGEREVLAELVKELKPNEWQRLISHPTVQDPDDLRPPEAVLTLLITNEQVEALDRLLRALSDLM